MWKLVFFLLLGVNSAFGAVAKDFRISDNNGRVLNINSDGSLPVSLTGNVGLGSATPGQKLDVQGQIRATSTTAPTTTIDGLIFANYQYAIGANDLPHPILGYLKNTGSTVGIVGHGVGGLFWSEDNVSGAQNMIGAEGRVDGHSGTANLLYEGVNADVIWTDPVSGNSTTFAGSVIGFLTQTYVYNFNGSTPRNQGTSYGGYLGNGVGALIGYGLFAQGQTGATAGVSAAIGAGNYKTLQVGSDTDGTTLTQGISFGVSNDTDLYRAGVNYLKTDSRLDVQGTLRVTAAISSITVKTSTNQACNTTCGGSMCIHAIDNTNKTDLACTDATADTCTCLGP